MDRAKISTFCPGYFGLELGLKILFTPERLNFGNIIMLYDINIRSKFLSLGGVVLRRQRQICFVFLRLNEVRCMRRAAESRDAF